MAVKFETVKAGDKLWDYHSTQAGNTTMRRWDNWDVRVVEINHAEGWAVVRWNGNAPKRVSARYFRKLRRTPGKVRDPIQSIFDAARARDEREAAK